MALRNIIKYNKYNAIVILLIAVITFIFFTGNSAVRRVERTIRRSYMESLTGDVVIQKKSDVSMNLFGANTLIIDSYFTIPVMPAYDDVMELVSVEKDVAGISSQVSGRAFLDFLNIREPVLLCGIDASSYFSLFPGIVLEEGRFLKNGEYGVMITEERAQRMEKQSGIRPVIGMPLLFTSGGSVGFKIREAPLVGIFSYQNPGQFMNEIILIDPQTVRVLNSIQVAGAAGIKTEGNFFGLLGANSDDIFDADFGSGNTTEEEEFSVEFLENFLSASKDIFGIAEVGGGWNFILLRLKKGISAKSFIQALNKKIEPFGLTAVNWRTAAGNFAILSLLIQILFNSGIFLISAAGLIAAVNIFLISVFRRTREIGTLRTIGASDYFIRSLIFSENLIIALIAGITGVLGGYLFTVFINRMDLQIQNELIISMMGGNVLRFDFLPSVAAASLAIALLLGLSASIYPVEAAVKIQPIVAVRRG